jgi:site-specific DNA-adenine methylase
MRKIRAPFPYYGGKYTIVDELNRRFGDVDVRIDPFCGSAAWILASPPVKTEIINDLYADVVNAYRAIRADPDAVAHYCDYPVSELDRLARIWTLRETLPERAARCAADPNWYDARAAGYYLYTVSTDIKAQPYKRGPWVVENGKLVKRSGVNGMTKSVPKQVKPFGTSKVRYAALVVWFRQIAERLRGVVILCGDWLRAVSTFPSGKYGATAILIDPPYPEYGQRLYATDAQSSVWFDAARWAVANGDNPLVRIAVCGYWSPETDAVFPSDWARFRWTTQGGFGNLRKRGANENRFRECVWFSPHCKRG